MNFYNILLHSHSGFRWLTLLALTFSFLLALKGWLSRSRWTPIETRAGRWLVVLMDIQAIIGFVLYLFVSPTTKAAFSNFGAAMRNSELRFYAVEHLLIMLIAVVLVHVGRSRSMTYLPAWKRHRNASIFFGLALLLVLAGIPWNRALF